MNKLVFIGGPSASGKTTLVEKLNKNFENAICYRRVQGFFDIAKENEIEENDIYKKIKSSEVDEKFINICENNEIVFSDVHYAIQLDRSINNICDIKEEYVSTISDDLFHKLQQNNIEIILVYLNCSAKSCYERQKKRFNETKRIGRSISLNDAKIEHEAEKKSFLHLADLCDKILVLESDKMSLDHMSNEIMDIIYSTQHVKKKNLSLYE